MNPDLRPAGFDEENLGGRADREERTEPLFLTDPASPIDLPPEHFDAWLDRLVDGEIAEPQRRALVSRLEHRPDGWRRCALAFLEAQAWREALEPATVGRDVSTDGGESIGAPSGPMASVGSASAPRQRARPKLTWYRLTSYRGPLLGMVAAAASFVLAFGLGLAVQKAWLSHVRNAGGHTSEGVSTGSSYPSAAANDAAQWGTVQFVVDGPSGTPQQMRVPAVEGPDPAQWLRDQPPAIPDEIVRALRSHGHHVQTKRRYVPVPLDDGRSAVFPFDQVEVRFRGGNGFQ